MPLTFYREGHWNAIKAGDRAFLGDQNYRCGTAPDFTCTCAASTGVTGFAIVFSPSGTKNTLIAAYV
jgi:hypothetical protein